ncbi:MAG: hypothetical protein COA91_12345 [Robiginitomaculum sp.]|nr:MAG: hypothetical protein COA91_12345 [Robiginitomaculum sp.]
MGFSFSGWPRTGVRKLTELSIFTGKTSHNMCDSHSPFCEFVRYIAGKMWLAREKTTKNKC